MSDKWQAKKSVGRPELVLCSSQTPTHVRSEEATQLARSRGDRIRTYDLLVPNRAVALMWADYGFTQLYDAAHFDQHQIPLVAV